jgi:spore coat protein U-like protein
MTNGSSTLQYKLYSDSGHTVNVGVTVGTDTIAATGNGLTQTITIYGQIPANQLTTPGVYVDTVTATITY